MKKFLLTLASSAFYFIALPQAGSLDLSFGTQGFVMTLFPESVSSSYGSSAIQADGKIVAIGTINNNFAIARYNVNGTIDNSFSGDGMTIVDFGTSGAADVAIQADGKIVVVGSAFQDIALARLNPDGSLDSSFSGDGKLLTNVRGFFDAGSAIDIQADGKIVVLGTANFAQIRQQNVAVIRYNADGTLDPSFAGTGIRQIGFSSADFASDMLIQPDGKIVLSATANFVNPSNIFMGIARLNSDGSNDATFNGGAVIIRMNQDFAGPVALQPDGKIVLGGSTNTPTGRRGLLFRFNTNGSFDNSFSGDGILFADPGVGGFGPLTIQPDGKIIVAPGAAGVISSDIGILRFNADGTPDNSFSGDGMATADFENGNESVSRLNIWNNRLYAVGATTTGADQMGMVAAFLLNEFDTGMLTCPGNRVTNVEPGLCSAVINNIDPILNNPGSTVNYILTGATNWNGTGSVSGFRFPAGLTTVTYRLTNDATKFCSFTLDISDPEFPQGIYPPLQTFCFNGSNNYSLPLLQATDNCGIRSIEYEITGATTRSGGGNNPSGFLAPGMNLIKWTIKDISFNTKVITAIIQINPALTVTIPDVVSLPQGVKPNTVYIGYPPAAYVTLQAQPVGGAGSYATHWSNGSAAPWNTVQPVVQTTYTVTITDLAGCTANASKTINVIDVRCGDQNNKVVVCKPDRNVVCVDFWTVADFLSNGSSLGNCDEQLLTRTFPSNTEKEPNSGLLVFPNPSQHEFKISLKTGDRQSSEIIIRDQIGRVVERIWIKQNQMVSLGSSYRPGIYFAEVIRGTTKFTTKLIKQ